MSKCADEDQNHFCDVCGVQNSHCMDIDNDHNCNWCGAMVTEHNYVEGECTVCGGKDPNYVPPHEHVWSDATCKEPQKCECGETQGEALGHVDANLDIDCDREGCTSKIAPPADSTLSNFTANNLGSKLSTSNMYYVEGTIVEVLDAKNGVFLIDDGTGEKFYFRLPKNEAGESHASWTVKLVLGDKVRLYGKINKYTVNTAPNGQYWPAMQSPVAVVLEQHAHVFGDPTCTKPGYCECGQDGPAALGHNDVDANGFCDACGWNMKATLEEIATQTKLENTIYDSTAKTMTWNGKCFAAVVAKGKASSYSAVMTYDHQRLYKDNQLEIHALNDCEMIQITIVVPGTSYIAHWEKILTSAGYTYTVDGVEITFAVNNLKTITLVNTSGSTTRVSGVKIAYVSHKHSYAAVVTAPTCTEGGYTTYTCACGDTYTGDEVAALGHTAGAEATCTTAQTCTVCGTELVAALGHSHSATVTAPTCTEAGYTTYTCACGDTYTADEVAALGHTAGEEATCTTAQTCTVCGEELVAALGHDMVAHTETLPTCTEAGVEAGEECSRCGHKTGFGEIPALGHDYNEGQCTRCGEKDPDYVPDEPVEEPSEEPEQNFFARIWAAILAFFQRILAMLKK